ncbi:hypothetical protein VME0621_01028 [Vibrio mediterranei]|nr:hypothetical protein VSAK1_20379 [Vibrio mediterranei AK1]SBO08935.1 hypothetical protein VME0621_01028 [Vibrio mediterranei]
MFDVPTLEALALVLVVFIGGFVYRSKIED